LGNAYLKLPDLPAAQGASTSALAIDSGNAQAHLGLGNVHFEERNWEEAIAEYKAALVSQPEFPEATSNLAGAYLNLGVELLDQKRVDEAIEMWQESIRLDSENASAHYNLGVAYTQQGNFDSAIAAYQQALDIDPDHAEARSNLAIAHFNRGVTRMNVDDKAGAIADFEQVLEISKDPVLRSRAEKNLEQLR